LTIEALISIGTPTHSGAVLNGTSAHILTEQTENKNLSMHKFYGKKERSNHGFGKQGLAVVTIGHGEKTHAQLLPQGARVANVVVAVVLITET
jgi:hypothetical protein